MQPPLFCQLPVCIAKGYEDKSKIRCADRDLLCRYLIGESDGRQLLLLGTSIFRRTNVKVLVKATTTAGR